MPVANLGIQLPVRQRVQMYNAVDDDLLFSLRSLGWTCIFYYISAREKNAESEQTQLEANARRVEALLKEGEECSEPI